MHFMVTVPLQKLILQPRTFQLTISTSIFNSNKPIKNVSCVHFHKQLCTLFKIFI